MTSESTEPTWPTPERGESETTVLVVEDEAAIRRLVRKDLERANMRVTEAESVGHAIGAMRAADFDVVILDLALPDGSGLEVLSQLRQDGGSAHVIVLSGASTLSDRIRGLELGADDYVVKPFFARELTARVAAVRRRQGATVDRALRFGALEIDIAGKRVLLSEGPVEVTTREFELLAFLAARPGHVFSRSELLRAVWKSAPDWQTPATVTEHIRRLRTKIEIDPRQPLILRTVRGSGYRFDPPAPAPRPEDPALVPELVGVVISIDGQIVDSNADVDALVGASAENPLAGRMLIELVAPQSVAAVQRRWEARAAGAESRSQVVLVVGPGGVEIPVEVRSEATLWQGLAARRSELRLASRESLRVRREVTGVLSEVSDAVIITDAEHHVRSWNVAAERLYGWGETEVLGRHRADVVEWIDVASMTAAEAQLLESGRWHGSCHQCARDGSVIRVRTSAKLIRDEDDGAVGIVYVTRRAELEAHPTSSGPYDEDVADLQRGLERDEFEVHYQRVVDLTTGRTLTLEALVRWNHPDRGLLGPEAFLTTAEQSGLIVRLGAFVLDAACRQTASWRQEGIDINIAVNVSAKELADPAMVSRIAATAQAAGFDLGWLWLEITETSLIEDVAQARHQLEQLASLGVGISIDDFGTGWASLVYLREFPVHVLKIDRSFVIGIDRDADSLAIVRSTLALGTELDLVVVAEGIETEAQHLVLRDLGCTVGQGYLYGRPVPAHEVDLSRCRPIVRAGP